MNSLTLKEKGFTEFIPLKTVTFSNIPENQTGVLILVDSTLTGKPTSDILYIGKTKKPAKRIFGGYMAGYGGKASRKIHSMLLNEGYMEKVALSWMISDSPKLAQLELLETFKKEYGKYPAWNAQKKNSKKPRPLLPKVDSKKPVNKAAKPSPKVSKEPSKEAAKVPKEAPKEVPKVPKDLP
jgi:hypothetical protein